MSSNEHVYIKHYLFRAYMMITRATLVTRHWLMKTIIRQQQQMLRLADIAGTLNPLMLLSLLGRY